MGKLHRSLKVVSVFITEGTKPNIYQAPTALKPFLYFSSVTLPGPPRRQVLILSQVNTLSSAGLANMPGVNQPPSGCRDLNIGPWTRKPLPFTLRYSQRWFLIPCKTDPSCSVSRHTAPTGGGGLMQGQPRHPGWAQPKSNG